MVHCVILSVHHIVSAFLVTFSCRGRMNHELKLDFCLSFFVLFVQQQEFVVFTNIRRKVLTTMEKHKRNYAPFSNNVAIG